MSENNSNPSNRTVLFNDKIPIKAPNTQVRRPCELPDSYPEIHNVSPNPETVRLLLDDYASQISEETAAHTNMYQHAILSETYPKISDTLECIGIVEMKHTEMLAEAIHKLGGDPQYYHYSATAGTMEYWNGEYVNYSKLVRVILMHDIALEEATIAQYMRHIDSIPIPSMQALLRRFILDEQYHLRLFTDILKSLG